MEKIWLKSYPSSVPVTIDTAKFRSLADLLEQSLQAHASATAFVSMGIELTYAELEKKSRYLAGWLQSEGFARGARIAVMLPNLLQYPVAIAAILRAGYVVVNVNPLYTPRELEHQLNDSGAEAILLLEPFAKTLAAVQARTSVKSVVLTSIGDMLGTGDTVTAEGVTSIALNEALARGAEAGFNPVDITGDDVAVLQYTGGTTGVSKGATLLHRNLIANILQSEVWREPAYRDRTDIKQHVTAVALPLYHIFGLTVCCLLTLHCGGMGILIPNPRDLSGLIRAVQGYAINSFPGVNTMFNALLNERDFAAIDFSKLVQSTGGGMAIQQAVAQRWLASTGVPIIEGYGLSETSPCVTSNPSTSTVFNGNVGLPLPSTEISIRDDTGREMPLGERGEICIRGPQVMAGYWNRPEETAEVMTPDGFFKSGDIGLMTEGGFVKIVDRKKDMILVSGFNVYPNEVEDVVAKHPGVFEVAAVGVPDAQSGEAVKLFVVKKDPALTDGDIFTFCKTELTGYKRPKVVEFCTELPKTNVGKILRRALRDEGGANKK